MDGVGVITIEEIVITGEIAIIRETTMTGEAMVITIGETVMVIVEAVTEGNLGFSYYSKACSLRGMGFFLPACRWGG